MPSFFNASAIPFFGWRDRREIGITNVVKKGKKKDSSFVAQHVFIRPNRATRGRYCFEIIKRRRARETNKQGVRQIYGYWRAVRNEKRKIRRLDSNNLCNKSLTVHQQIRIPPPFLLSNKKKKNCVCFDHCHKTTFLKLSNLGLLSCRKNAFNAEKPKR